MYDPRRDLLILLDYNEKDERRHYESNESAHGKSDHIYLSIKRLREWLEKQRS